MGGQSNGVTQGGNNPQLAAMFQNQQGYQQAPIPRINAPQLPGQLTPSPGQQSNETLARLLARFANHAPITPVNPLPTTPTGTAPPVVQTPGLNVRDRAGRDR